MVRLIKYLRGIIDYSILYSEFLTILKKYNNGNWILESNNIKSLLSMMMAQCLENHA